MKYIKETFTANTGGGCLIDYLILNDGRCVGINDESLVLYASYEQAVEGIDFVKMLDLWEGVQQ